MRFGKFLGVGGVGFLLDLAVFLGALHLAVPPLLARVLASVIAISFTWLANRQLTFQSGHPVSWSEYLKYFVVSLAGAGVNIAIFSLALWQTGSLPLAYITGAG